MACKCATATDQWHGWECSITEGACIEELIAILSELDPKSSVINGDEENIRVFPGRENKKSGKPVVMIL